MKRLLLFVAILLLTLALAACSLPGGVEGNGENAGEETALTPVTLVLDWTPNINHSGAYVAQAEGYFAEEGLDVSIIQPGDNLALQLVASGEADFGYSYQEELTYARVAEMPVVSLAAVIQHNTSCFAAPKENNCATVADFAGKTYGGWGGAVEQELLYYLMEQEGIADPGNSVKIINLGSADFFSATQGGGTDFSWIYYGVTGVEAELRGVALDTIYLRDLDPVFDYYTPVLAASEDYIAANPDLVRAFMRAISRGYAYADEHPQETADILLAANPELDKDLVQAGAAWIAGQYQGDASRWGEQKLSVWSDFAAWLTERGLLGEGFVAEDVFSNDYLP